MFTIVAEIINETMYQVSGVMCDVPFFGVDFRVFSSRNACYDPDFLMSVKSEFFVTNNIFIISRENT